MNNYKEKANEKIKETKGFILANNYNVLKVEQNYCQMEGIVTETSINPLNIVHGGYIFGLADTAAGIAAMTEGRNVVTVDANINYFKPATGNKIIATAQAIKIGKTISVYEVLVTNEENELIAKSTLTYYSL